MEQKRNIYETLIGKAEWKRLLIWSGFRWGIILKWKDEGYFCTKIFCSLATNNLAMR
jgi:hypothetical protein